MKRLLTLAAFAGLFALSCNKDDGATVTPAPNPDPTPATSCRITALRDALGSGEALIFSYDANKRLTSIETQGTSPAEIRSYTYFSGGLVSLSTIDGAANQLDSVRLNGNGFVTSIGSYEMPAGTLLRTATYEYNADKVSKATFTRPGQTPSIHTYEYDSDGNISKRMQSGGPVHTYEYYNDKPVRPGDFFSIQALYATGAKIFNNTHLVKSETSSGVTTKYTYEFDGSDRITRYTITRPGSDTTSANVEQSCD